MAKRDSQSCSFIVEISLILKNDLEIGLVRLEHKHCGLAGTWTPPPSPGSEQSDLQSLGRVLVFLVKLEQIWPDGLALSYGAVRAVKLASQLSLRGGTGDTDRPLLFYRVMSQSGNTAALMRVVLVSELCRRGSDSLQPSTTTNHGSFLPGSHGRRHQIPGQIPW